MTDAEIDAIIAELRKIERRQVPEEPGLNRRSFLIAWAWVERLMEIVQQLRAERDDARRKLREATCA